MAGLTGVGNSYSLYSNLNKNYSHLASGKKVNRAADNAAGMAIIQKLESSTRGHNVGYDNLSTGQSVVNIADGALGSITDSLQRMRELAVGASNGILTDDDKRAIQDEIDQLKQGINDVASRTNFNTKNLLDGSNSSMTIAADGNGSTENLSFGNSTLSSLGIENFSVMGDFDIGDIDKAISAVSSNRGVLGAQYNRLEHSMNYSALAAENLTASQSRMEDTDYGAAVTDLKKNQLLQTVRYMMQSNQMNFRQRQMENFFL
jgi:flagellin